MVPETLKTLTPKQILQRLPIVLAQIKACNTSGKLLNGICQIIHSLYRAKQITKEVYNSIINSIKLKNKMDTIFMNFKNRKTSDHHRLLLLYQILTYTMHGKIFKKSNKNKFKISNLTWNEKFELLDGSYYVIDIQDYFKYMIKDMKQWLDFPIREYVS